MGKNTHIKEGGYMALTQCEMVVRHIEQYGSITAKQAERRYGIMRLAARISNLREKGIRIVTETKRSKNRHGKIVRYAVYKFEEKEA